MALLAATDDEISVQLNSQDRKVNYVISLLIWCDSLVIVVLNFVFLCSQR